MIALFNCYLKASATRQRKEESSMPKKYFERKRSMMIKPLIFFFCILLMLDCASVQAHSWQPSLGNKQLMIWPGAVPDAEAITKPEETKISDGLVAGKPCILVHNVSQPTMTV